MNILSTAAIRICRSALLVRSYSLKTEMTTSWAYQSLVIWGTNVINGMVGSAPGLMGAMKVVAESVAYTAGETVRCSSPSVPYLRFDWADAAFELSFK